MNRKTVTIDVELFEMINQTLWNKGQTLLCAKMNDAVAFPDYREMETPNSETLTMLVHIAHVQDWEVCNAASAQPLDQSVLDRTRAERDETYRDIIKYCRDEIVIRSLERRD